jgi:hypothetical protein
MLVFALYTNTNQKIIYLLFCIIVYDEGKTFPIFIWKFAWNWFLGKFGKQLLAQESWERGK